MIDSIGIYRQANKLVDACGTRNAISIADKIGIEIMYVDYFKDLLGMYTCKWKKRIITLNGRMDEYLTQMVVAHEIGHDTYHRALARGNGLKEFTLFYMKNDNEYVANAFGAHLLLETDEVLHYAQQGYDVVQVSKAMNSEINLMLIKMQELNRLGYNLKLPTEPQADFFKKVQI